MTKVEIIEETARFYSENPKERSIEDGSCLYNSSDGRHCAVGRCLLTRYKEMGTAFKANNDGIDSLYENHDGIDKLLEPKYHGHNLAFWSDLQYLHDNESFWDKTGLTALGEDCVNDLKDKYARREINEIKELAERFGVSESQITITKDKQ